MLLTGRHLDNILKHRDFSKKHKTSFDIVKNCLSNDKRKKCCVTEKARISMYEELKTNSDLLVDIKAFYKTNKIRLGTYLEFLGGLLAIL